MASASVVTTRTTHLVEDSIIRQTIYSNLGEVQLRNSLTTVDSPPEECCAKCCGGRCKCCGDLCLQLIRPCLISSYQHPDENSSYCERIRFAFLCPPHGLISRFFTLSVTLLALYFTLYTVTGEQALPGGHYFGLLVLLVLCYIGGEVVKLIKLPALLGKFTYQWMTCFFHFISIRSL